MTQRAPYLLTVCIPMVAAGHEGDVLAMDTIESFNQLGNPATREVEEALSAVGTIHFVSLSVIREDRPKERPMLIVEATGDGDRQAVISALDKALGDRIFPILARACGIAERRDLTWMFDEHSKQLSGRTPSGRRISGRSFSGIDDFDVAEIKAYDKIAAFAKCKIDEASGDVNSKIRTPMQYLKMVREKVDCAGWQDCINAAGKRPMPLYTDKPDSPWERRKIQLKSSAGTFSSVAKALEIAKVLPLIVYIGIGLAYFLSFILVLRAWIDPSILLSSPPWTDRSVFLSVFATSLLATVPAIIISSLVIFLVLSKLRRLEKDNVPDDEDPNPDLVASLLARENAVGSNDQEPFAQNHMISVAELQPGFFRRYVFLPFAFRIIKKIVESQKFRKGFLADMGTVQHARWFVPPGSNKLVFYSNYDGSWENYFEDFIVKARDGVTMVWSNCKGFPRTSFLLGDGAKDGDRFKRFARRNMIPTPFWYSAYPHLSAERIRKNGLIVHGIAKIDSLSEAEAWLELFVSTTRPDFAVEYDEIQNLVFGGNSQLPKSRLLALRFPDGRDSVQDEKAVHRARHRTQSWLADVSDEIAFGEFRQPESAQYLAISAPGLMKLGISGDEAKAKGFSAAFVHGMDHPARQHTLGDLDSDKWQWGGKNSTADAVLLLYAGGCAELDRLTKSQRKKLTKFEIDVISEIDTSIVPYTPSECPIDTPQRGKGEKLAMEPFGFADGISQPSIRGFAGQWRKREKIHAVEPGEFILGYRDNHGYFPPSPHVSSAEDCGDYLASPPREIPLRWPNFEVGEDREQWRDFGRNGSYLVIRQLRQDVCQFNAFAQAELDRQLDRQTVSASGSNKGLKEAITLNWVKARLVGRWPDGSSLVRNPHVPASPCDTGPRKPDNDFLFGKEDPQGVRCPLGAHIRRSNPRDSLNPESPSELAVANRHRLLRRGRTYTGDSGETGTLFMCLNADIERQFEFVQQTWMNNPTFHGLPNERDPIAATERDSHVRKPSDPPCEGKVEGQTFAVPGPSVANQFTGLSNFVSLQGGGYFFLPGRRTLHFLGANGGSEIEEGTHGQSDDTQPKPKTQTE